jgi:hypothetical protein
MLAGCDGWQAMFSMLALFLYWIIMLAMLAMLAILDNLPGYALCIGFASWLCRLVMLVTMLAL